MNTRDLELKENFIPLYSELLQNVASFNYGKYVFSISD